MLEQNKNPFKAMQGDLKDVPPELRKKVMADIATAKLILEMASLFTVNYGTLIEDLFRTSGNSKKDK